MQKQKGRINGKKESKNGRLALLNSEMVSSKKNFRSFFSITFINSVFILAEALWIEKIMQIAANLSASKKFLKLNGFVFVVGNVHNSKIS